MIEDIINSKVKIRILKLFCGGKSFYVSEAARAAKVSKSRASQCMRGLSEKGILDKKIIGRSVMYSLSSGVFAKSVISQLCRSEELLDEIGVDFTKQAKKAKPISIAIFGSSITGIKPGNDVDFFVISAEKDIFYKIAAELTEKFGIRISVTTIVKAEFIRKAKMGEEFSINILANHKLIYGKGLESLIW